MRSLGELLRTPLPDCTKNGDQSVKQGGPYGIPPGSPPPTGPWMRSPIIPDSWLPDVLKRIQPAPDVFRANRWDLELLGEADIWNYVASHGGIQTCCQIPDLGAPIWNQPPWQAMPSQGKELNLFFSQPTNTISGAPGPFDGTDTVIGQYRCPIGWDAAISKVVFGFTGNGFDDFSGNLFWRLMVGKRFVKNLGNVQNTFGSLQTALLVPGRATAQVISGQTITILAAIPNGSPVNGGRVTAAVLGWEYPRR